MAEQITKHFGNWFDSKGLSDPDNANINPKALRDWARSKEHEPAFKEHTESAKHEADKAHKLGMKMRNKDLKEHEQDHWG